MKERVVGAKTGKVKAVVKTKRIASEVTLPKPKKPMGRPTEYTDETADLICERISLGESLRSICRDEVMPSLATVMRWFGNQDELYNYIREQYARAKEIQADSYEDMMLDVANTEQDVNRARLIIDTMKWTASKLKPRKYGDKIDHTTNGRDMPSPIISLPAAPTE